MTIVPTQFRVIGTIAAIATVGAVFTLVHRPAQQLTATHADASTADQSADQTGTQPKDSQVTVNGVPVKPGTTKLTTGDTTATVNVSGNSTSVTTEPTNSVDTSNGNVNISVHSNSSTGSGSGSSTSVGSSSSSTVMSNSYASENGHGSSSISIQTH